MVREDLSHMADIILMRLTAGCDPCDECLAWASNEIMVVEFIHLKFPWKKKF